jgi:hypothetical protein
VRTYAGKAELEVADAGAFCERLVGSPFENLCGNVHVGSSVVYDSGGRSRR